MNGSPEPFALCMVADGMGGHAKGQEASQLAVQSLVEHVCTSLFLEQMTPDAFLNLLVKDIQSANQDVYQRNQEQGTNMGTTMTLTLVHGSSVYVAHVGDSRAYLYHEPAGLSQITRDHSLVAALVQAGVLEPDDIYNHPKRNQIYRCLGEKADVEVDTFVVSLTDGHNLLLCSDGLWEMVRDPQIAAILTSPTPVTSQTANALVQAALANGGADNVSVIVVQLRKSSKGI
jgi:serine/threonine protein phosphatase PrpC